jgi:hypothetical protein
MDKEFIKKYNLQEAVNRFKQINEYTFITSPIISEDGDENDQDAPQDDNQQPPMGQNDDNSQPQGQQSPMMQDNDAQQDQGMSDMSGNDGDQQQMPPMNGGDQGQNQPQMGDNPDGMDTNGDEQGDENTPDFDFADDQDVESEEMEPDDEVIDVDDLTQSQETTEYKVDDLDGKIEKLLSVVTKFQDAIENSNEKIASLQSEFEKRNPTEQEKLNIRSQSSFPYAETPRQYWDKVKAGNPNYQVMYDNDVPANKEQETFEIRQGDIDGMNYKDISDSLDTNSFDIRDYLNF